MESQIFLKTFRKPYLKRKYLIEIIDAVDRIRNFEFLMVLKIKILDAPVCSEWQKFWICDRMNVLRQLLNLSIQMVQMVMINEEKR